MIDVDNEVSDLQVAQIGEKGSREISTLFGSTPLLFEHIGLGVELKTGAFKPEALREVAARDKHRGGVGIL